VHHDGILANLRLSREQVEKLILDARVKAGWIDQASLEPPEETASDTSTEDAGSTGDAPASGADA
jgi:N utilization substance protein A